MTGQAVEKVIADVVRCLIPGHRGSPSLSSRDNGALLLLPAESLRVFFHPCPVLSLSPELRAFHLPSSKTSPDTPEDWS